MSQLRDHPDYLSAGARKARIHDDETVVVLDEINIGDKGTNPMDEQGNVRLGKILVRDTRRVNQKQQDIEKASQFFHASAVFSRLDFFEGKLNCAVCISTVRASTETRSSLPIMPDASSRSISSKALIFSSPIPSNV